MDGNMTYLAAVLAGHRRFELRSFPVPKVDAGEALVAVRSVNVCPTDIKKWNDAALAPILREMPLILGHEIAGEIVALGAGVAGFALGDRVAIDPVIRARDGDGRETLTGIGSAAGPVAANAALLRDRGIGGGFAELVKVPAENLIAIPDALSFGAASLIEPLADVVHGIALAGTVAGKRCAVYGLGPMGLLHVAVLASQGARVIGVEPREDRRAEALEFGAEAAVMPGGTGRIDMAFLVAGGAALAPTCAEALEALDPDGTLVIFASGTPGATVQLDLNKVHYARQHIIGVVGFRRVDAVAAIDLLCRGAVNAAMIRQPQIGLEELDRGFAETGSRGTRKFAIDLPEPVMSRRK
jgi:threonine dehydrogenase-like Zn-dependent dehydrogenase